MSRSGTSCPAAAVFRTLIAAAALALGAPRQLHAVSASPEVLTLTQPDGTAFQAVQWGDENFHGHETIEGFSILLDEGTGQWRYAEEDASGKLTPSGLSVGRGASPPAVGRHWRPKAGSLARSPKKALSRENAGTADPSPGPAGVAPATGVNRIPVIAINFRNTSTTYSPAQFESLLFGTTGYSMRTYYQQVSYGAFSVTSGPGGIAGWYTAANTNDYYGRNVAGNDQFPGDLVYEAVAAADPTFDFAPYDQDGNCYVDVVDIVHQGTGEEASGVAADIWSHRWNLSSALYYGNSHYGVYTTNDPCPAGGVIKVNDYVIQPEKLNASTMITVGVFTHEYGHALGLPDLYDTDDSSQGVGNWSLMAAGSWCGVSASGDRPSHLDPWCKFKLGWVAPQPVSGILSAEAISAADGAADVYQLLNGSPAAGGEYFLVENRQKTSTGFDAGLPGAGLLIWHVDEARANNNAECKAPPCAAATHYKVALVQADNLWDLENSRDRGDTGDPYPGSTSNTAFNAAFAPNSNLNDGSPSQVSVSSVGASGNPMSATLVTPAIIKGPYLQNVTPSSVVVMWETSTASDSRVDYGLAAPDQSFVSDPALKTMHEVPLTGLQAGATYFYKVTSGGIASSTNSFPTAPDTADAPFRFVAYGDTRTNTTVHAQVAQSIIPHQPDFVLHVGDLVNSGRTYGEWGPQFFTPAADLLKGTPLFPVLGNHEYSGAGALHYFDFFSLPNNEKWYAFTYGSARFIALNVCDGCDSFAPGSAQYTWLTGELASAAFTDARWQFVWFHNPPYTAQELDGTTDANVRTYLVPLFEQYGVDVVFNGDDHQYRHSLRNGIHYVVTGGGGAPLHDLGTPMAGATLIYAEKNYEHCVADVDPGAVDIFASRINGTVMDTFSLAWPTNLSISGGSVEENQPSGTVVGTLSTTDPNSGDTFTYSFAGGSGGADNGSFAIDGNKLKTAAAFDYEAKNSYSIRVRGRDQGGLWYEKAFTIAVTPVNDAPIAAADGYDVDLGQTMSVAAPGVIGNDSDVDSGIITAVLVGGPAHAAAFTLNANGSFSYEHDGTATGDDSFTYRATDGALQSATTAVTLKLHTTSEADNEISVSPDRYLFGVETLGDCIASRLVPFEVRNTGSAPRTLGTLDIGGIDALEFAIGADACSGSILEAGTSCTVEVKFCPSSVGSKTANLQIPSDDPESPVLSAFLYNHESPAEAAWRRMPSVLESLNVPETMTGGQSYTITWSQLGYDEGYLSNIVFFNCTGVPVGTCGDNYGSNFAASGNLVPESVEPGGWTYNGIQSKKFNYRYSFTAPSVGQSTDIVIRFYRKSQSDADAGLGSLSLLIPGNLSEIYYDAEGRRILKRIVP
jgi:immune inhibitor A